MFCLEAPLRSTGQPAQQMNRVMRKCVYEASTDNNPIRIKRLYNVASTVGATQCVASTLIRHCLNIICPLGYGSYQPCICAVRSGCLMSDTESMVLLYIPTDNKSPDECGNAQARMGLSCPPKPLRYLLARRSKIITLSFFRENRRPGSVCTYLHSSRCI